MGWKGQKTNIGKKDVSRQTERDDASQGYQRRRSRFGEDHRRSSVCALRMLGAQGVLVRLQDGKRK